MPTKTEYTQGTPCWIDLASSNVEASRAFYTKLFGWEVREEPTDEGVPYLNFTKDGKKVCGAMQMSQEMMDAGIPTIWSTYIAVDDVEVMAKEVDAAGGMVTMPPMDVMDQGRMAMIQDPSGAMVGLWQAAKHTGAELVNETGTWVWAELMSTDLGAAKDFYATTMGYTYEPMPGDQEYYTAKLGDETPAGMMPMPEHNTAVPSVWLAYFAVDDINEEVGRVAELGGKIMRPVWEAPGVGHMSLVADPQGGMFMLMQMDPSMMGDG